VSQLSRKSQKYIIGKEVGEQGTPHLQCFFQFKHQQRFSTLKNAVPTGHWEVAKGSVQQNYTYCSKEGDYDSNIVPQVSREDLRKMVLKQYDNVEWHPWQKQVLDWIKEPADSRTIYWVYEPVGNVGKSFLCKYLACQRGTILSSGKATDVFNQVNATIESGTIPKLVICDIPRVISKYVSYQALEKLKDGCLYSGKYEGGLCLFPNVHVICFSNERPETSTMSKDRWKVHRLQGTELFLQTGI
jgi:hypothetical protein